MSRDKSHIGPQDKVDGRQASSESDKTAVTAEMRDLRHIEQLIGDREVPAYRISRLIARKMVQTMEKNEGMHPLQYSRLAGQQFNGQIRALRQLQKTLTEGEILTRRDVLDIEGPKFKVVFTYLVGLWTDAMAGAGLYDALVRNIKLKFRDLVTQHQEDLKREINKATDRNPSDTGQGKAESPQAQSPSAKAEVSPEFLERRLIGQMMDDPEVPVAQISRRIAGNMIRIIKQMTQQHPLAYSKFAQKEFASEMHAYREMHKQLVEGAMLAPRDTCDLDGPKFKIAFEFLCRLKESSLVAAGVSQDLTKTVMQHFRDSVTEKHEDLKRAIREVDASKK